MTIATPTVPASAPARPGLAAEAYTRLEAERLARVAELRKAILDGTYSVDASVVADAIVAAHS